MSQIHSPYVIRFEASYALDNQIFIIMEFAEGGCIGLYFSPGHFFLLHNQNFIIMEFAERGCIGLFFVYSFQFWFFCVQFLCIFCIGLFFLYVIYIYVYMHICIYICIYVYMYICTHTYITSVCVCVCVCAGDLIKERKDLCSRFHEDDLWRCVIQVRFQIWCYILCRFSDYRFDVICCVDFQITDLMLYVV